MRMVYSHWNWRSSKPKINLKNKKSLIIFSLVHSFTRSFVHSYNVSELLLPVLLHIAAGCDFESLSMRNINLRDRKVFNAHWHIGGKWHCRKYTSMENVFVHQWTVMHRILGMFIVPWPKLISGTIENRLQVLVALTGFLAEALEIAISTFQWLKERMKNKNRDGIIETPMLSSNSPMTATIATKSLGHTAIKCNLIQMFSLVDVLPLHSLCSHIP